MSRADRIVAILKDRFAPATVEVTDESHRHVGHAGAQPGGETHYRVRIVAAAFAGLGRLARHRLVNDALAAEFAGGLHALTIEAEAEAGDGGAG